MDCSAPGSSVHGILQVRKLEWAAVPFSKGSSWPRDWTQVSCIAGRFFIIWATRENNTAQNNTLTQMWFEHWNFWSGVKMHYPCQEAFRAIFRSNQLKLRSNILALDLRGNQGLKNFFIVDRISLLCMSWGLNFSSKPFPWMLSNHRFLTHLHFSHIWSFLVLLIMVRPLFFLGL